LLKIKYPQNKHDNLKPFLDDLKHITRAEKVILVDGKTPEILIEK